MSIESSLDSQYHQGQIQQVFKRPDPTGLQRAGSGLWKCEFNKSKLKQSVGLNRRTGELCVGPKEHKNRIRYSFMPKKHG